MPNPYTITINFETENINDIPDTYDLILTFTVDLNAANQVHTNKDKNLEIKQHGSLEWDFDLEDSLLMPGDLNLQLTDEDEYLAGLLFGSSGEQAATRKQFQVELQINSVTEFIGFAVEDEIQFNHGIKILSFKSSPQTDVLNKTSIYDDDDLPLDPTNRTQGASVSITAAARRSAPNDDEVDITHTSNADFNTNSEIVISGVLGMTDLNRAFTVLSEVSNTVTRVQLNTEQVYESGGTQKLMDFAFNDALQDFMEEIFQLVDSSITVASSKLDFSGPGWKLNKTNPTGFTISAVAIDTPVAGKVRITHTFTSSFTAGDTVFIDQVLGITDLNQEWVLDAVPDTTHVDIVLATAQTYTSGGRIYEVDEVDWDSTLRHSASLLFNSPTFGITTIGDLLRKLSRDWFCYAGMVHQQKAFFKRMYEYNSGTAQTLGVVKRKQTRYRFNIIDYVKVTPIESSTVKFFDAGIFSSLVHRSLKFTDVLPFFWRNIGGSSGTNVKHGAGADPIYEAKDPALNDLQWYPHGQLLANLYDNYRGNMANNREVTFMAEGVGYNPLLSVNHESEGFWVVGLKKDFAKDMSILKCIFIEAT